MTADDLIKKLLDYLNNNNTYTTNSYSIGFGNEIDEFSSQLQNLTDTLKFMNGDYDKLTGKTRDQVEKEKKYFEDLKQIKNEKNKIEKEINEILDKERKKLEKETKNDTSKLDKKGNLNKEGKKQVEEQLNSFRKNGEEIQQLEKKLEDLREQRYNLEIKNLSKEKQRQIELQKQHEHLSKYVGSDIASKLQNSKIGNILNAINVNKGSKVGGKVAAGVAIINTIGETASIISNAMTEYHLKDIEKQKENVAYHYDVLKKTFAASSKIATKQLDIQSKIITNHFSGVTAFLTKGVKESAFEIANAAIDINSDLLNKKFSEFFVKQNLKQELYVRSEENKITTNRIEREQSQGVLNSTLEAVDTFTGGIFGGVTGAIKNLSSNYNTTLNASNELQLQRLKAQLEYQEQLRGFIEQMMEKINATMKSLAKQGLEFTSSMEDIGLRIDRSIKEGMKSLGYSNYENYKNSLYNLTQSLKVDTSNGKSFYLDKTDEDIVKYQANYAYNTGRTIEMDANDTQKAFLMSELWDENTVNSLTGQMDYFNHSVEDSVDMFYEMYQTANRMGISNKKYSEILNKNLKMAQKYTFNGGSKALMKMAIWAEKSRFNMDSLDSMITKVQEGGLEGTIQQAAQLQVLGGHAAMGADPLAMLYEAWSDPEAYAQRMYDMTREYATFNNQTGEVDIKGLNAMMVANIAKAQGRSYEDLRAELTQRVKNEKIDSQINGRHYSDQQKQLLYSRAQYDTEDGKWKIKVGDTKKDINNLSEIDFDQITPVEKNIEDYVYNIWDWLRNSEGAKNYASTRLGFSTMDNTIQNTNDRIEQSLKWFADNAESLKTIVEEGSKWVTDEDAKYKKLLVDNAANFETALNTLTTDTTELQKNIDNASQMMEIYSQAAKGGSDAILEAAKKIGTLFGIDVSGLDKAIDIIKKEYQNKVEQFYEENKNDGDWRQVYNAAKTIQEKINNKESFNSIRQSKEWDTVMTQDAGNDLEVKFNKKKDNFTDNEIQYIIEAILSKGLSKRINTPNKDFSAAISQSTSQPYNATNNRMIKEAAAEVCARKGHTAASVLNEMASYGPPTMPDGIVSALGSPMTVDASKITPIHDGTVARTDPQDHAIFAKTGGPFDTLFNGIFAKINEISNVLPRSMEYIMPLERIFNEINHSKGTANNSKIQIDTVKIELNGKLELSNSNGQSVNIIDEIKNNPILLRTLSQLISESMEKNINGGRSAYTGGVAKPRFN